METARRPHPSNTDAVYKHNHAKNPEDTAERKSAGKPHWFRRALITFLCSIFLLYFMWSAVTAINACSAILATWNEFTIDEIKSPEMCGGGGVGRFVDSHCNRNSLTCRQATTEERANHTLRVSVSQLVALSVIAVLVCLKGVGRRISMDESSKLGPFAICMCLCWMADCILSITLSVELLKDLDAAYTFCERSSIIYQVFVVEQRVWIINFILSSVMQLLFFLFTLCACTGIMNK